MFEEFIKRNPIENPATPSRSRVRAAKNTVLERIAQESEPVRPARRLTKRAVMVPAIAVAVALGTVTAGAAGISILVSNVFGNSEIAREMLENDIFHDEDENVSIDVVELITDKMASYATVRYTALTDEGRRWIADYEFDEYPKLNDSERKDAGDIFKGCLYLMPRRFYDDITDKEWEDRDGLVAYRKWSQYHYTGSFTFNCKALTDRDTENERYFMLMLELEKTDTAGNEAALYYPMTDGAHTADISTDNCVKEKFFTIEAETDDGKYYIPIGIRVSQLSATLYGDFTRDVFNRIGHKLIRITDEEYESFYQNTYLLTRSGEKLYFMGEEEPHGTVSENSSYGKYVLLSSVFQPYPNTDGRCLGRNITVDPDDIVGIQIEDKYYCLVC